MSHRHPPINSAPHPIIQHYTTSITATVILPHFTDNPRMSFDIISCFLIHSLFHVILHNSLHHSLNNPAYMLRISTKTVRFKTVNLFRGEHTKIGSNHLKLKQCRKMFPKASTVTHASAYVHNRVPSHSSPLSPPRPASRDPETSRRAA